MIHAIILDYYQADAGPNEYRVSVAGSLEYCRAASTLPDSFDSWFRADYSSCVRIENHQLGQLKGAIFRLVEVSEVNGFQHGGGGWPVAAVAGGTFLAGMVVGAMLTKPLASSASEEGL